MNGRRVLEKFLLSFIHLTVVFALDCEVQYLKEPPASLDCNPYLNDELLLECTIIFYSKFLLESQILVGWHHSQQNKSSFDERSVESSSENYTSSSGTSGELLNAVLLDHSLEYADIKREVFLNNDRIKIKSTLKVFALNESDTGYYWCSIRLNNTNGTSNLMLPSSNLLLLQNPEMYSALEPCDLNTPQFKQAASCNLPTPSPMATISSQMGNEGEVSDPTTQGLPKQSTPTVQLSADQEANGLKKKHLKEFYITIGSVPTFALVIVALGVIMVYTCVKYRRILKKEKRKLKPQESIITQAVLPSDYLVPIITTPNGTELSLSASRYTIGNPTYISTALLQELLMDYSIKQKQQQQQHHLMHYEQQQHIPGSNEQNQVFVLLPQEHGVQRKSDVFLHSYESIKSTHDYEDIIGSGNYDTTLTMTRNEAYLASNSYISFMSMSK